MTERERLLRIEKKKVVDLLTLAVLRRDTEYALACDKALKQILKELDKERSNNKK